MTFLLSILIRSCFSLLFFFFFNDTATTEIYTLSLHDALPIFLRCSAPLTPASSEGFCSISLLLDAWASTNLLPGAMRSEEHTSELQSQSNLVCRLLLEKKKKKII